MWRASHNWLPTMGFLVEWRSANVSSFAVSSNRSVETSKWNPPTRRYYKINTDVGLCRDKQLVEVGIVIRNEKGLVRVSGAQRLKATVSPLVVEALAIFRGILLALERYMVPFVVESYALNVITPLKSGISPSCNVGIVISDILSHLEGVSF
ncbi:hypothetical protein Dsin_001624 [Dipteronia sinensis]|uniref:RNase H type-1 domain-containing protein n=1 Tax=Dipteronia sinensis TaxID=43782 RepID=A0AAE0B559_9ROSI|nr:hypothetical protein Dsin_001624 [Dipteronia sinensis]